jgi:hypothetical protein
MSRWLSFFSYFFQKSKDLILMSHDGIKSLFGRSNLFFEFDVKEIIKASVFIF